ncbi:hypothetical protein CAOG_009720 [Capsaspora owczarzaki ATCC 30864]|uniref:Reactive oxygen species modulator 1 n=1 Tax=Capsaspora owczarzaki (strain ATCC 30864) TaxID=595528 RepID=A0A0D2VQP8_CAPO3|nr:hypothetical protein CAOG_009720 [Capsaspora owczarzaki ATCC 30864]
MSAVANCFERMKYGAFMGCTMGCALGLVFGGTSALRYRRSL